MVFARSGDQQLVWPVVGYFNSKAKIQELSSRLALGTELEPAPLDRR